MSRIDRENIPKKSPSKGALKILGVGASYIDYELNDLEETTADYKQVKSILQRYIENIHVMYRDRANLLFYGSNGSGKTMCMSIIAKHYYMSHYKIWMGTLAELITLHFTKLLNENQSDRLFSFRLAEVIIIDEVGKEMQNATGSNIVLFEEILRKAETNNTVLILGTNMTTTNLEENYGNSIYSILDSMIKVQMTGKDYRKQKSKSTEALKILQGKS